LEESVACIFRIVGLCTLKTDTAGCYATFLNSSHTPATFMFHFSLLLWEPQISVSSLHMALYLALLAASLDKNWRSK